MAAFAEYVDPEWIPARHHLYMIERLKRSFIEGENGRLIISMPVGHGKSVYSSLAAPAYIFGQNPHERILAVGHTQDFVEKAIARKVRAIVESDRYKALFPDTVVSRDSRAADYFTLANLKPGTPGHYIARGAGGGIAGYRSTRLIADDLYPNMKEANSAAFRDMVATWWHSDAVTRLLPGGNIALVMTRWHSNDLIADLLDAMKKGGEKWELVILPAICEDAANDPLGRKEGEALWPDFHTIESLLAAKAKTPPRVWNTLYQCNPIIEGGGIVEENWFRYWTEPPPENMVRRRFVSVDAANSATARSDYTVATAWIEGLDRKFYLMDILRVRVEFAELLRTVSDFAARNKASAILVEDAGHGKAMLQSHRDALAAPLIGISPYSRSKELRFDEVSPLFESGAVILPKRHELLPDVVRELCEFPQSKHDDIVDSITHALRWAKGGTVKKGTKKLVGAA